MRYRATHQAGAACALNAEPAFVGDGERAIAIGNRDPDEWADIVITVYGAGIVAENKGQPTGAYSMRIPDLPSLKRHTIQLAEFQKADGARWQPLTMRPARIEVDANLRGQRCRYASDLAPAAPK